MEWIRLSAIERQRLTVHQAIKGMNITVTISPYDIPVAVKGEFNKERQKFEIRFRYMDEEEPRVRLVGEHVSVLEGVNSSRLLGLDIGVEELGVDAIALAVKTIGKEEELLQTDNKEPRRANLDIAKNILAEKKEQLAFVGS